jgi:opacity protein-like surface antigen
MNRFVAAMTVSLIALSFSTATRADNPLNFYLGGALGVSSVRMNAVSDSNLSNGFDHNDAGGKVFVGIRPIPLIGAEVQYVFFGDPSDRYGNDVRQQAGAVYGMLYAPIPIPLFDVYAKAGLAWLRSTANTQIANTNGPCQDLPCGSLPSTLTRNNADAAFGAGVQIKLSNLAIRGEYERIQGSAAKPDLLSFGLTWTF